MDRVLHDLQRKSTKDPHRLHDPTTTKVLVDPWHNPYVYRVRDPRSATIYSIGRNETDDTVPLHEDSDDIGNW